MTLFTYDDSITDKSYFILSILLLPYPKCLAPIWRFDPIREISWSLIHPSLENCWCYWSSFYSCYSGYSWSKILENEAVVLKDVFNGPFVQCFNEWSQSTGLSIPLNFGLCSCSIQKENICKMRGTHLLHLLFKKKIWEKKNKDVNTGVITLKLLQSDFNGTFHDDTIV